MIERLEVRHGAYHDSVRLMQASRSLQAVEGVTDALAAMATDLNIGLLQDLGFDLDELGAVGANDLLVAVRAEAEQALDRALAAFEAALVVVPADQTSLDSTPPRTIASAASDARVALISVPGEYAFVEAMDALRSGLHVMVFSDNVTVQHELALKKYGTANDLLVMGPDCGTSIINGVGLGFANAVEPGSVGIVGASGTGIQELCCLLDAAGVGVRHALGTGSRDLSEAVGGLSTLQALRSLDEDPAVQLIAVVSKPPAPAVAGVVQEAVAECSTAAVVIFMGETSIEEGAVECLAAMGVDSPRPLQWRGDGGPVRPGSLRGLFSGGTLRDDARFIAEPRLGPVGTTEGGSGHTFVDYGDDEYTRGRAHPMIDQTVRLDRLQAAIDDRSVGTVLMDVVLGYGAHPDPAVELAPVVRSAVAADLGIVVSLCGTQRDPQGRDSQAEVLRDAGASVFLSNAAATKTACDLVDRSSR